MVRIARFSLKPQRGGRETNARALASGMGRSRIGWALSVAAPWCVAFVVLVSITAEAEQEPTEFTSAFDRSRMIGASGALDPAIAGRPLRAVDEDGEPLPIVQARYVAGDRDELAADADESEPNGALKRPGRRFPAVDRGAKGDPLIGPPGFNARRLNGKRAQAAALRAQFLAARARRSAQRRIRSGPYDEPAAAGGRRRAGAGVRGDQLRRRRDAGAAARIRAQLVVADLERRGRGRRRER